MHPGGFWSKDYLVGYLPDFEAESGIARGRRNKVRVYRVRTILFDEKRPVTFPLKAAGVRTDDSIKKLATDVEPLAITDEQTETDRDREIAVRRKADERDPDWSDEKPEANKEVEEKAGIIDPSENKPYSWMDHKIEFVPSTWHPKDRRDDTVYITPLNYEYQPGVFHPLKRRVFGGKDTPRPPGIPPQQWAVSGFWPQQTKENVMLEWEEKKKLLDISDEHTIHTTPFTPIAATVAETPCAFQHKRPVTTIVEFIADGLSPLADCQQESGQAYYHLTYNDACRKRIVKQRMKHVHEVSGNVLLVVNLPDHSMDITESGAIWKNFMIAARINQNNGGSLLLNLPTDSNWWSTRCMKKAQEELCFRMDELS